MAGTVHEAGSGLAVGGAWVAVLRAADFSIAGSAVADESGAFEARVDPGSYFVYVIDPAGDHTARFYGPPTTVTVTTHDLADADPVMTSRRGSITATVTEMGTGTPVAGVWAVALSTSAANTGATELATVGNGAGEVSLPGLVPGSHYVGYLDPTGAHASVFYPDSPNVPDATALSVSAGSVTTADAALPAQTPVGTGAAISGTLTDASTGDPVTQGRIVALRAADYAMARGAVTDAGGHYSLDVAPGDYKLAVLDGDGRHAMEWFDDQPNTGLGSAATVTAPATADAALAPTTGAMAGTITDDPSSDPIAGVWVVAIGPSGIAGGAVTAADGSYTVDGLAPGTYRVTFADPNGGRAQEYFDGSADYDGATPVNITAGATVTIDAALALP